MKTPNEQVPAELPKITTYQWSTTARDRCGDVRVRVACTFHFYF